MGQGRKLGQHYYCSRDGLKETESGPGLEAMVGNNCCNPLEVAGWANC
jgi:hypothetical protein